MHFIVMKIVLTRGEKRGRAPAEAKAIKVVARTTTTTAAVAPEPKGSRGGIGIATVNAAKRSDAATGARRRRGGGSKAKGAAVVRLNRHVIDSDTSGGAAQRGDIGIVAVDVVCSTVILCCCWVKFAGAVNVLLVMCSGRRVEVLLLLL